jgi:AcrR family transcriptional regulator
MSEIAIKKPRQRAAMRRAQILRAARKLFARKGYEAASMNEIVRVAKTSIGNCYFYFPTKERLLSAILEETIDNLWRLPENSNDQFNTGSRTLAAILYYSIRQLMEHRETARLMLAGYAAPQVRQVMYADFLARITKLVGEYPELLTGGNAELEVYAAFGSIISLVDQKLSGNTQFSPHEIGIFLVHWMFRATNLPHTALVDAIASIESREQEVHKDT